MEYANIIYVLLPFVTASTSTATANFVLQTNARSDHWTDTYTRKSEKMPHELWSHPDFEWTFFRTLMSAEPDFDSPNMSENSEPEC